MINLADEFHESWLKQYLRAQDLEHRVAELEFINKRLNEALASYRKEETHNE